GRQGLGALHARAMGRARSPGPRHGRSRRRHHHQRHRPPGLCRRGQAGLRQVRRRPEAAGSDQADPGNGIAIRRVPAPPLATGEGFAESDGMLRLLTPINAWIARLCMYAAVGGLLAIVVVVAWQVFGRYVLNDTPTWAESLALVLVLYVTMLG